LFPVTGVRRSVTTTAMAEQRRFLTLDECAAEARVSRSSVRHWLRTGKLRSVRPGRRRLVERTEFERFLGAHPLRGEAAR
jgi:excisionase family DNA binding protein